MERHLPEALKEYLDSHLDDMHLKGPSFNPFEMDPNELLCEVAKACIGIKSDDEQMVELFQSAITRPAHQSWCMDFAQSMIAYVEEILSIKSALSATESCLDSWNSNASLRHADPKPGSLSIWRHGEGPLGHCGIVIDEDSPMFHTVEGNTSDSQEVERTGDGVYLKHRALGTSGAFTQVGFLRVFP